MVYFWRFTLRLDRFCLLFVSLRDTHNSQEKEWIYQCPDTFIISHQRIHVIAHICICWNLLLYNIPIALIFLGTKTDRQSKPDGIDTSKSEGLGTKRAESKRRSMPQVNQSGREWIQPSFSILFHMSQWMRPTSIRDCQLIYSVTNWILIFSRNTLRNTTINNV